MALLEIAANGNNKPMKLSDISAKQNIALNYLEQIFSKLKSHDLVKSVKGPGGGYFLDRDLESLKIIEIIDGVEENTKMTRCSTDKTCRKNGKKCMTHDLWCGLSRQIRGYFSTISVADILSNSEGENKITYLDHNATTNLLDEAKIAMFSVCEKTLNASAIHKSGRYGQKIIEKARKQIAELVGIVDYFKEYQITFTATGTEANNLILSNFQNREIFISAIEHVSILSYKKFYDNVILVNVDENGLLDLNDLRNKLANSKKAVQPLVSVIFANNETGVIQNIKEIVKIAHEFDALVHSDFVQAAGKMEIDLIDLDLDFATISAHKIGGPVGAAALIGKVKYHLAPHIIGGGQEKGLRSGTENIAAIAGFGKAAEIVKQTQKSRFEKMIYLRDYLEENLLKSFPNIKIVSKDVLRLPNTSLIINERKKSQAQIIAFDLKNIALSSGASCSSGKVGLSATLSAMNLSKAERESAIRISLGITNTKQDIDNFLEKYNEING